MKAVQVKDLVVGKIYSDVDYVNDNAILMRFIGRDRKSIYFKSIAPQSYYFEYNHEKFGQGVIAYHKAVEAFYEVE